MKPGRVVLTGMAAAVLALTAVTPAHAGTSMNGVCEERESCFFWGPNQTGAVYDTSYGGEYDFGGARYVSGSGQGQGALVKNNAASVWNRVPSSVYPVLCVYYDENWKGASDRIGPGARQNLGSTRNNNASYQNQLSERAC